jgi:hypothetical protein
MEADWSVEIGKELPVIAVPWEGFVDLRKDIARIREISEAVCTPSLAEALVRFNAPQSHLFTTKCDRWLLAADEIDALEFDAKAEDTRAGIACYVDVISRRDSLFSSFTAHEKWSRATVKALRAIALPQCRLDFVVRPAVIDNLEGFGITFYVAACARNQEAARPIFEAALNHAIAATIETSAIAGE